MKSKHLMTSKRAATKAFTLIELLIVIVIIAILASVAFPVTALVMENARKTEARYQAKGIKSAIANYQMEYGKLPFQGGGGGNITLDTVGDSMIAMLSGLNINGLNPKKKTFYQGKPARGTTKGSDRNTKIIGGIYGQGESIRLVDPWGFPYYIVMDSDYDDLLDSFEANDGRELRQSIAVYSKGRPDKKSGQFKLPAKWLKSWK